MARAPGTKAPEVPSDHELMLESGRWKEAVQAYLATIAFADAQVGRLLDGLDTSAHRDNTIVVFTSEHGELMGAHRLMFKSLMYEESAGVPLILSVPGMTDGGRRVRAPVSTVDLTPTLLDLIVVNDATEPGAGFEVETNRVVLLQPGQPDEALPLMSKAEVADRILDRVEALLPVAEPAA